MQSTAADMPISRRWATASGRCARKRKAPFPGKIKFRNGNEKNFVSPIRTTNWGTIQSPADYAAPGKDQYKSQELAHEPDALNIEGGLPALAPDRLKQGVV